jgi:hypothetical protein
MVDNLGLSAMGLRTPAAVRCLNISEQVAQTLHVCTGPYSKGRALDTLDILLWICSGSSIGRRYLQRQITFLRNARATPSRPSPRST